MIHLKNLFFSYAKKENLFTNLDLELSAGNIYGLLGKNGAGKTSLLKIITGLVFPQKGHCRVMDFKPQERLPQFLADIYFIPEEFFVPSISIRQYLRLYAPFYPQFDLDSFNNFRNEFELPAKAKLTSLSYGQKKKFLLAFGLAANTRLLILDEPTTGLDIPSKSLFRKLLVSSITEDRSFIIATHQVRDVNNLIDPIIILYVG